MYLAAPRRWLLEWFHPERFQRSLFAGYCMAVGLTAAALLGRSWLEPFLGDRVPFAFFFLAVAITAWFGGFGPCLLAVALGTLASWYSCWTSAIRLHWYILFNYSAWPPSC